MSDHPYPPSPAAAPTAASAPPPPPAGPPGWYPDPWQAGHVRWFDGWAWWPDTLPAHGTVPGAPPAGAVAPASWTPAAPADTAVPADPEDASGPAWRWWYWLLIAAAVVLIGGAVMASVAGDRLSDDREVAVPATMASCRQSADEAVLVIESTPSLAGLDNARPAVGSAPTPHRGTDGRRLVMTCLADARFDGSPGMPVRLEVTRASDGRDRYTVYPAGWAAG